MSSTRNKNSQGDYNLEKKHNSSFSRYFQEKNFSVNKHTSFMSLGSNPSFKRDQMSSNAVDVESMLRGIRSTNLEGNSFSVIPDTKTIGHYDLFERNKVYLPKSFHLSLSERPNVLN